MQGKQRRSEKRRGACEADSKGGEYERSTERGRGNEEGGSQCCGVW